MYQPYRGVLESKVKWVSALLRHGATYMRIPLKKLLEPKPLCGWRIQTFMNLLFSIIPYLTVCCDR